MSTETPTPRVDAMCERRFEPPSGLIWANDARILERENAELRGALEALSIAVRDAGKTGTEGNLQRAEDRARAILNEGSK